MEPAALNFRGFQVGKVLFDRPVNFFEDEFDIKITHENRDSENSTNDFACVLIISIEPVNQKADFNFQVEAWGLFNMTGDIPEKVKYGFKTVSAPAIVYPFIRAFVGNLTVQTGMKTITLPAVNFASNSNKILQQPDSSSDIKEESQQK